MKGFMQTVTAKIIFICLLVLGLLIPRFMISGLVEERQERSEEVKEEVSEKWGKIQVFKGPFIEVPVRELERPAERLKNGLWSSEVWSDKIDHAFTPDNLKVDVVLSPEVRSRGIFDVLLYSADIEGEFTIEAFEPDFDPDKKKYLWDEAVIKFFVRDLHGISAEPVLVREGDELPFVAKHSSGATSFSIPFIKGDDEDKALKFRLALRGTEDFYIDPMGEKNVVTMKSNWNNPSFVGRNLPKTREISETGFEASWEIFRHETPNPYERSMVFDDYAGGEVRIQGSSVLGAKLLFPVDFYQQNERAVKYAIIFIVLTFVAFFLIEVLQKLRLHPIQYLMVGCAMLLFYALLLSLSEHLSFNLSYLVASLATIGLISLYCWSVLGSRKIFLLITGFLSGIYVYLFVLLKSQDYSLISGTVFLFVILAAVMYLTRKVDWYDLKSEAKK
jgi:inner membrane protein